ncbi:uncharacterized protein A4U43_C03F4560 [Asparagus officinalis]|uniref:SHSP domain-containing protein n=1 Tax=Asparagus officinalis TaxID=4686 RepID=A0A5P1F951_ASPOF|nr:inactive protein RESTRICTED TEV MOVEMENT 2-like [Asparagus officinalis]ONK74273.1 uncharacterized protein A4U43_C03F4560 [Asparagus officinalis]
MDPVARSYDDFIPSSHWITEEGLDTLIIELPGFKKEHLRIQLDNFGNLRTSGERPIDGNRWKRFRKEFRVPDNCNASEIRAKFESGLLTITLPKLITEEEPEPEPKPEPEPEPKPVPAPTVQAPEPEKMKQAVPETDFDKGEVEEGASGLMVGMKAKRKQLMINFAVAAVIMIGVGIFVAYKFRKISEAESTGELLEYFDEF